MAPQRPLPVRSQTARVPVLEAVGDQLSFGQVIQPGELPAAVPAGVERREALIAPLQLCRRRGEGQSHGTQPEVCGPVRDLLINTVCHGTKL